MKYLTEQQAEAAAAKMPMPSLTEAQEIEVAVLFTEKCKKTIACFLTGHSTHIKSEFRRFRKEEIERMRFDAWKAENHARWDSQQCRWVVYNTITAEAA